MNHAGATHFTPDDRLTLERMLREDFTRAEIAKALGKCERSIYYEINRGKCIQRTTDLIDREVYCADVAERKYQEHLRDKGPDIKLGTDHKFAKKVEELIVDRGFSPAAALKTMEADEEEYATDICVSTLYNYIYRGDVFLVLSTEHLREKGRRHEEHKKSDRKQRNRGPSGESIEHRPEDIQNREEFGHWEMDCVVGTVHSKKTLLVLTERMTRTGIILPMRDHTAASVVRAINRLERKYGKDFYKLFKTITVDNGSEFADCEGMERSCRRRTKRTKLYYCHPYSAYERGSNENMNRMIRWFFPKGTNFDTVADEDIRRAEEWINSYPRRVLGWRSADAAMREALAQAA